ncbi:MAG: sensor domain-containing diguanylate cyclase [Actinobacteria bacterium]|nr:sensor domain-containing diguanylate cyclase [Actinomycetota bacterium]
MDRETHPVVAAGEDEHDAALGAVFLIGFSEASRWLVPGTLLLLWTLGMIARDSVSPPTLAIWFGGSLLLALFRLKLQNFMGDRGRFIRPLLMTGVFGSWIAWYFISLVPREPLGFTIALIGVTTWWTASAALLASNPLAFANLSTLLTAGVLIGSALHGSPLGGSVWLVLMLDAVMVFTYRDRRTAYLRALEAAESVRRLADEMALVFESVRDGVMVTSSGTVTRLNETMAEQLGREIPDVVGRHLLEVLGSSGGALPVGPSRVDVVRPDGSAVVLELTGRVNELQDLVVWSSHDITDRVAREAELHSMIALDDLTGLATRRAMFEHLEDLRREARPVAVLAVDVDGFKQVNDRHGHGIGDAVLRTVSERLVECVGGAGFVARLGGDEFVVVLSGATAVSARRRFADDLIERSRAPMVVHDVEVRITLSIGLSASDGTVAADELLHEADLAMYEVKRRGRDGWEAHGADGRVVASLATVASRYRRAM